MAVDRANTPAVRFLKASDIPYSPRSYRYVEGGGTREASRQLGVAEHRIIKTLVFKEDCGGFLLVLMHGDRQVSTKALARALRVKEVTPASPRDAQRVTGYQVGGISPFGTRRSLPVFMEASILELDRILINGGRRGLLVELDPRDLNRALSPTVVSVSR